MTAPQEIEQRAFYHSEDQCYATRAEVFAHKVGYLAAAAVEPRLAVIAELEALVPLVCEGCRDGWDIHAGIHFHAEPDKNGDLEMVPDFNCHAAPIHEALAALRKEE